MTDHRVVLITASNSEEASNIGKELVEKRLAACVNIVEKIRSLYWWEGKLQDDQEILLIIKTHADKMEALINKVKECHSYSTPEVISMKIQEGNPEYLNWIKECVKE